MEQALLTGAKPKQHHIDYPILVMVTILCAFGLVMVYSASYYYAMNHSGANYDGFFYLKKQLIYMAIGFPLMLIVSFIPYRFYDTIKLLVLLVSIGLLVAVLAFGKEYNGARRWIYIGSQSLQPSEIAKFGLMMYMCSFMTTKRKVMHKFVNGMLPMIMVIGITCGLILLQPNMSMAVIVGMMAYALLFIGGADIKQLLGLLVLCIVAFFALAYLSPYRWARMTTFTNPWNDGKNGLGSGYQLVQSLYALGSGGMFGLGLNGSRQKLLFMTYGESDFIFAILGEELGFVGAVIIMLCYTFIIYRGIEIARRMKDYYGKLLASGISVVFAVQILVNIGVVSGSFPTTGQALPFISAGGSSLLIFLGATGILLNISRYTVPIASDHAGKKKKKKKHAKTKATVPTTHSKKIPAVAITTESAT